MRRLNVVGFTACLFLTTQAWAQDFAYFVSKDTASTPVLSPGHLSVEPPTPTVTPMQESCGPPTAFFELDALKGIPLGHDGWLDVGGSYRARYHGETNIRPGSSGGLSGIDDSFWLHQTRLWFNGHVNDWLDFRVGFIDAATAGQEFAPRAREVNRTDLYQAHVNVLLHQDMSKLTARVGRQEIRYGS
ncbi:MAG: alginate export family protein, partial [Planctomycetota bacterium]|nr:alginate export family protein [Planctomycetota bacterium]